MCPVTPQIIFIVGYEVCQVDLPRPIVVGRRLIFLRELEQGLVPEWRVKYFDYKVELPNPSSCRC